MPAMDRFDEEVKKAFAKRLKAARKAAGYTSARAFADVLSVEENRYRHWERGSASPDLTMTCRICKALDMEPNDLLPLGSRGKKKSDTDHRSAA